MTDDEILREYLPWLRVVAGNLIGFESPDVQDLVQEGYIAMWRALKSFDPEQGVLDYWLKFKASNRMKVVAVRASEKPRPLELDRPNTDSGLTLADLLESPGVIDQIELAYHHGEIAAAIDRLTPAQKRYVIARFWLGLSGNEMRQLGVFAYDPSALWNRTPTGARWKLEKELEHLR